MRKSKKGQEPVEEKQEKITDPYDSRVIYPGIPRCVVFDNKVKIIPEKVQEGEGDNGTLENTL